MKRNLLLSILILTMIFTTACSETSQASTTEAPQSTQSVVEPESEVDIDLTKLSTTMIYASVYDMLLNPDEYTSKNVKITGEYYAYKDPTTEITYHLVIITDATNCCQQGVEFALSDGEYPTVGDVITVVGSFRTYLENGYTYCELSNAYIA
ncbi:MAG: hypothetical protein R3Y32_03045 [Bacillota bacterium]